MKKVILIRHGHAVSPDHQMKDEDRPLTQSGLNTLIQTTHSLHKMGWSPDLIVSSSAERAASSARIIASQFDYPESCILIQERLYLAEAHVLLQNIQQLPDDIQTVILVGHNPGITELAIAFSTLHIDAMQPGSATGFEFMDNDWRDIHENRGTFSFYFSQSHHIIK